MQPIIGSITRPRYAIRLLDATLWPFRSFTRFASGALCCSAWAVSRA